MRTGIVLLWLALLLPGMVAAETERRPGDQPAGENAADSLGAFRENWILGELRSIRQDMMAYRNEMTLLVTDRELEVADKSMSYATSTVTYFFYLIAGAASLLALVGWTTIRDLKDNIRVYAEKEMSRLTAEYENRLAQLEKDLRRKSRTIAENQEEIERTNEIHGLWLKASKEPAPEDKIAYYDRILELRADDVEALAWKADALLELGEQRWAMSLCNRVLEIDANDTNALYQRACAHAVLGETRLALEDLARAVSLQDNLRHQAAHDEMFQDIAQMPEFRQLLDGGEPAPRA